MKISEQIVKYAKRDSRREQRRRRLSFQSLESRICMAAQVSFDAGRVVGTSATAASSVSIGRLDFDNHIDLVVANNNPQFPAQQNIQVFRGNGTGAFTSSAVVPTTRTVLQTEVGDYSNDGRRDVFALMVSFAGTDNEIQLLRGNGAGGLAAPVKAPNSSLVWADMTAFDIWDLNSDGKLDVVMAGLSGVAIRYGNGNGTFNDGPQDRSLTYADCVTIADVTGDGVVDVLVGRDRNTSNYQGVISLLVGNGDDTFQPTKNLVTAAKVRDIEVVDLDRDGKAEVLALEVGAGVAPKRLLNVYKANASNVLTLSQSTALGFEPVTSNAALAIGDFDLDFRLDVAVARRGINGTGTFVVVTGNGDGTFDPFQNTNNDASEGYSLVAADFNNDGRMDIATTRTLAVNVAAHLNNAIPQNAIRGFAYQDTNENQRRLNEPGLAGRKIYIDANKNARLDAGEVSTISASDGSYEFIVPDGFYVLRQELITGWVQTGPFTPVAQPLGAFAVTVSNRETVTGYDFGSVLQGNVRGVVYNDRNVNGIFDVIESPVPGATVFADLNNNGLRETNEPLSTVRPDGKWGLNLAPGQYRVRVAGGGPINTTPQSVLVGIVDSSTELPNTNFGVTSPATISGKIFYDFDADGVEDFGEDTAVGNQQLFLDLNNNAILDAGEPTTTSVVSLDPLQNGRYKFTDLYPKEYVIRLVKRPGFEQTAPSASGAGTGGPFKTFALGGFDTFFNDFGIIRPIRVSGTTFRDSNANGVFDSNEQALSNVPVFIDYNNNGLADNEDPSTLSTSTGSYLLKSTRPGTFNVRAIRRSGFNATVPGSSLHAVTFAYGSATPQSNFGFVEGAFSTAPYLSPIDILVGSNPTSLATGDFNRDGNPDFVVVSNFGDSRVFLGQGNGLFTAGQQFSSGEFTRYMIAQDISGDGVIDLITANDTTAQGGGSFLRGRGDGTFFPPHILSTIDNSYGVAVANFDGFGLPDIAYVGASEPRVGVIVVNDEAQGFDNLVSTNNPSGGGKSLAAGDFNRDGKADLVVANPIGNAISVLLGNGDATFTVGTPITNGISFPNFVTTADFNGDGKLDVVASNEFSDEVRVVLGNGDGTFGVGRTYAVGSTPTQIAVLDIDRDGKLDLIVSCRSDGTTDISGGISILRGRGDGTFVDQQFRTAHTSPTAVAVADYDGDSKLDIVAANFFSSDISFLKNGTPGALGTISGIVYRDDDIDGVRDATEPGLAGRVVFIDVDNDGTYDPGERTVRTLSNGTYTFVDLPAGALRVRVEQEELFAQTSPIGQNAHVVTLSPGQAIGARNFAMTPTQNPGGYTFDDRSANFIGGWARTSPGGTFGSDQVNDGNAGKGTKSVLYNVVLPSAGYYGVALRWTTGANQAANVPVDVRSATNTRTVTVDQRINGGTWVDLGTYYFDPTGGSVTIRNAGTAGFVVVDALQLTPTVAPATIVKDNADATGVVVTGAWTTGTMPVGYVGNNFLHDNNPAIKGGMLVGFTPKVAIAGTYELFGRWVPSGNNSTRARYDIVTANGTVTVFANQRMNGGGWVSLGYFEINPATVRVNIRNDGSDGVVIADAIQLVKVQ